MPVSKKIDPALIRRKLPPPPDDDAEEDNSTPASPSSPAGKVIDLAFNPTWDKLKEMTIIDPLQGKLMPLVDLVDKMFENCIEIAQYRESKTRYRAIYKQPKPKWVSPLAHLLHFMAQWQKSVRGQNMQKALEVALAEVETRANEDEDAITRGGGLED